MGPTKPENSQTFKNSPVRKPDSGSSPGLFRFPFGPLSALLLSGILISLQSCLNYPARLKFGKAEEAKPYDPADNLISSKLVMELSHSQMEALDVKDYYGELRRYPVQVYRITYRSRSFSPLSALVLLPVGMNKGTDKDTGTGTDTAEYPLLAYHHGTLLPFPHKRLGAYEAPSFFGSAYRRTRDFFAVNNHGLPAAAAGYLTVLPDYMGYGAQAGKDHPFMIGPELGQEGMDAVRATYRWAEKKGIRVTDRLYLMGTSEGASAAMWAQRLIENAPDFEGIQVEGAYYAGPYHISSLLRKIAFDDGKIVPLFNWAIYAAWNYYLRDAVQRERNLSGHFRPEQYSAISGSQKSWQKSDIWLRKVPNLLSILLQKPMPKEKLFHTDFLEQINDPDSDFWVIARLLDLHEGWEPESPIWLYHNDGDPLIPMSNSLDAHSGLQAAGSQVNLKIFQRKDHAGGYLRYLLESLGEFSHSSGLDVPLYPEEPGEPVAVGD
ncbi:lipase family protein [Candidatus Haliotispira prima]|uniref:Lipase family protein n=1 Tax=Candidatus Haliotispira prima TaxID=3034016 RepID=A0ABY8MH22_9SPIO|nr:lipase family protein [Candidatus Haliotispira prima]